MNRRQRDRARKTSRRLDAIGVALLALLACWLPAERAAAQVPATCPAQLGTADLIDHDLSVSFCELCNTGTVRIVIENPLGFQVGAGDFSGLVVTENLQASGLTYVPGTTTFTGNNVAPPPVVEPVVSGATGSVLSWTLDPSFVLPEDPPGNGNRAQLVIQFQVERASPPLTEEGLVTANRTIAASVELTPECAPGDRYSTSTGNDVLPLREPEPRIIKQGRNVDAGQGNGRWSDPVYGHENDDVIWRIRVLNDGNAPLQDFRFDDSIVPGNFDINYVCDSNADATAAANGTPPARCVALGGTTTTINNFDVAAAFGNGANPFIVAGPGGARNFYLVGKITSSCENRVNTVSDVQWGCQSEPPPGGISSPSTGGTPGDSALLSTLSDPNGLDLDVFLTGTNTSQPMGSKGTVRIRIRNLTGGTVQRDGGFDLNSVLPSQYVVDTTFAPQLQVLPAYGNTYNGLVNTLQWMNPQPGTFPYNAATPEAAYLANTNLDFRLTSTTSQTIGGVPVSNMIRHGDEVDVIFRVVLIDPTYYDKVANLDVREEAPNSDPPDTDPTQSFPVSSQATLVFNELCDANGTNDHTTSVTENDTANPEDLDVDIVGSELIFILTNTGDPLPLTVALTNNGGHDADDYYAYVTFGEAMVVQTAPAGCTPTSNPPALTVWQIPVDLPSTASVYQCDRGVISPGETELLNFQVVKNTAASFDDDLTFRADVTGQITLSNGDPLWFPAPTPRPDGVTDPANDYTIDGIRARVIGYNLFKQQLGTCTENNPPPGTPDDQVEIGEECSFHVESGGWFGFQTPGFLYIAVQNIQVVDQNPDGQGYISSTDPLLQSTSAIQGVSLNPPPPVLGDAPFDWTFNTVVPAERITEKDHWFRADYTSRLLNDPIDTRADPNQHANISIDILTSTFEAIFFNTETNLEELYNLGPNTVGFPREVHRRVDLTVTEPLLTVTQEVCNETLYGVGPSCSNFVPLADDGDAFDTYIYRLTVANEAASSGVTRAPAYDVTVTTDTDPGDQLFVDPLTGDVLDNDGDALVDAGDVAGEGVITDNVVLNGTPAQIIASYTHSTALQRIDAGDSVVFYYRVDPDDDVAPLQLLTNTATATYDSLEGPSGGQTAPQGANGELGGARQYVSEPADAAIRIIPVEVSPKAITRLANTPLSATSPQPVSVGEELEFEISAMIPVSQLRSFVIRDQLPPGLSCSEAPAVNLDAPPYSAGGFVPGGTFVPTCTDDEVVWDFGNQIVTQAPGGAARFSFSVQFIARVNNEIANQENTLIRNGGTATVTEVTYIDEAMNPVVLPIEEASVVVREPVIALTKAFSVAQADAGDLPRVTVTATNTGTAPAYGLRVLDDLSAVNLSYAGDIAGANPPTADLATLGPEQPIFVWNEDFAIAPGETVEFSFAVQVDVQAEPLQILANTVQAAWASLPGSDTALNSSGQIGPDGSATGLRNGALPNAGDALNDYETEASAQLAVPPLVTSKVDLDPALAPEIGAHKSFQVEIALPEGTTHDLVVTDSLDSGAVSYVLTRNADFDVSYEFLGIASINGAPPGEAAFTAVPADGTSGAAVWSIGEVVTDTEDDLAASAIDPTIRITYFARINNDLVTDVGDTLQNSALVNYTNGETDATEAQTNATAAIVATEPSLNATKALTNVTPGKNAGDPAAFDDVLQYVVTITNGGNATAWDTNVVDTLPPELQLEGSFVPTALIGGAPVAGFVGVPAGAPVGPLVWGKNNGDESLDIPAGQALVLTYRVRVVTPPLNPMVIENNVFVDWTSLSGASVYERTGNGCPTITPPDDYCFGPAVATGTTDPVAPADALLKEITQPTATIGEAFTYRITIPNTPYAFPIHDVRIYDDLAATGVNLRFLDVTKVSGSGSWTPVNSGTVTSLIIEDTGAGIEIPAGEQITLEIRVVLEDTVTNQAGVSFTNTASYLYNFNDGDPASEQAGAPGTSAAMTIVEPDLTLEKSGPGQMTVGTPATFTLNVHNQGGSTAWSPTILDRLPDPANGGTCDAAPTAVTAQLFDALGTTPLAPALTPGSDYTVAWSGRPDCELTLVFTSAASAIGPDQRLIVSYQTVLDADSQDGVPLTNIAGVTEWFSTDGSDPDTAGDRRTYTRTVTDGTPGTLDHEDAYTTTVALPAYLFEKTVMDVDTGQDPALTATPGDTLHYRLRIENTGAVPLADFAILDELDALNDPALFQPGTLRIVSTLPAGADATGTDDAGGAKGTGVLDVRGLNLPNLGDSVLIEFEITLVPVIDAGTYVTNQSLLRVGGVDFALSDDPGVNGQADPAVDGDEDPTRVLIDSAPDFQVEKVSSYVTGDPTVLLAGETLRYTITVKNVGTADATDAAIRDDVPVNTQYVAGSTTLNGNPVADGPGGTSPLAAAIALYAPEDPTPGAMRADASATTANVATIVFDVVVDPGVPDGTVISNQAFVSAVSGGVSDQPSDDPTTALPDDPTRDVVGNSPLLFAPKTVVDVNGGPTVEPGDVLHYTITIFNDGAVAATGVTLTDVLPANTSYVAGTTTLNTIAVPDGGGYPLAAGIPISSSDLTPPLPGPGGGTLTPGESAVLEFDLRVNLGVSAGTIISNQATVNSVEVPTLLTDGDGNPATGPEPTQVVVGDGQQLAITKQVAVVGGGAALPGSQLEYVVRVTNIAAVDALGVVISDDLDTVTPGYLSYVLGTATMNGAATGITVAGSLITADYSGSYGPLQSGQSIVLRFRATITTTPAPPLGTTITNQATVTWNTTQTASASVSIAVGGMPGVGMLNGFLWHDADFDDVFDGGERALAGWTVQLLRNGQPLQTVQSDANGAYSMGGLPPNDLTGDAYALRFSAPGAGANTAALGRASSVFTNGLQQITNIAVPAGSNLQDLNLPIDPNGSVYDSLQRTPVAGAALTLVSAATGTALPTSCFDDPVQQGQVTRADGFYKFDLSFNAACPSGADYRIEVVAPGGLAGGVSQLIPPSSDASTPPFSVPACPVTAADAIPGTTDYCEVQPSELPPPPSVRPRTAGTAYYLHLTLDDSQPPGSSQIFNNHIALDPVFNGIVAITKTAASLNVSRGELVPYEITFTNSLATPIPDLTIVDTFPPGFHYVEGSARVNGVPLEPTQAGPQLIWTDVGVDGASTSRIGLLLAVGAGVSEGEFTNRAQAVSSLTGESLSGVAEATVRVVPDPTFDCTDVLGKVFDDANRNEIQDQGEKGLQGVRVVTARGLVATTDRYGRFHITCAVVPREDRGSNFVLKLDDRTLPTGYRMTTRQVQVQRATRGKALSFEFGAAIHRVVGLDMADAVFEPGTAEMRAQWQPRLAMLIEELAKEPAILRLSYVADVEDEGLVDQRLEAVKKAIEAAWKEKGDYELTIETEVFWRRGGPLETPVPPPAAASQEAQLPSVDAGPPGVVEVPPGAAVERHLPIEGPMSTWSQDPALLERESGDRLEKREVAGEQAKTVKLTNVVPPIHFASGVADIPPSTIERLRDVLESMRHLPNVRLHLVGHADDQPLSEDLSGIYGDNAGLSRERAGEVAEFLQSALALPPEAISFDWAGDSQPIASNATPEGRARNRRVEVEVWYDEMEPTLALEDVVVPQEIKRLKVCRTETVCQLRYREGSARRMRVKNLIAPLHLDDETTQVPETFIRQVAQALDNLSDEQNVTVKFIGYTDDQPLTGRAERIYGTPLALSKARARRVALAVQDALRLPTRAVASDGRGTARPVASNETERGRALNRRIEVEFWHDDPLQELPDEPQVCPDAAGAELVTKVYDPPWGPIRPLQIEEGQAQIPPGYADDLRRAMDELAGKTNVRLRFVGYTNNERLERRTALVYGDDIGLSTARARRAMEQIQEELSLSDEQVEHEGHGYVQSDDVVNAGFIQGDTSYVVVQVVYDELAVLDDYEGVEITPITRELRPQDPLALNLMRITVDGEPVDDPGRSLEDIQRCTDVALDHADIQFRFDDLQSTPRLSVSSDPIAVSVPPGGDGTATGTVRFRMYSNYASFLDRSEVRIFEQEQSLQDEPVAVAEVGSDGTAEWTPEAKWFQGPVRPLKFVLRAYDEAGHFDETAPQSLWMVYGRAPATAASEAADGATATAGASQGDPLLAGYGDVGPLARNIPLGNVGSVQVHGTGIPPEHAVWVAGSPVPVDADGNFVAEVLLPTGMHSVEVAVLDPEGNGELFLRDLEFQRNDWFYVGIADVTLSTDVQGDVPNALVGHDAPYDPNSFADARLAFYVNGKFGEDWGLVASADTREEPVEDLFSNFLDKSPDSLFRRIDPDYYYPTFGDDGTVDETAPTSGKFYVKLTQAENHALWGNFKVGYLDNELAHVDRGLYGGNLHYQSEATTEYGEQRFAVDGFAADPGTVPSREEFRGTGGSLYYLRHQDILLGSERLRIEVRDKASGIVTGVVQLQPTLDYDIDYLQGRILLTEPLSATVGDDLLVRNQGLSGNEAFLVAQYEYTPGFDDFNAWATGGQGHAWITDWLKVGLVANHNQEGGTQSNSTLYAGDVTLRASTDSWIKLQAARSEGLVSTSLLSDDGGFRFFGAGATALTEADANAYRADVSVGVSDFLEGVPGRVSVYGQLLEGGYSAPGMNALTDTQIYGGQLAVPVTESLDLVAKADVRDEKDALATRTSEVDVTYHLTDNWSLGTGVRNEHREDDSPIVPITQEEGDRTDVVAQVAFDANGRWRSYVFGQGTVEKTGDRESNNRGGVGGAYRITDRLALEGEASYGNLGPAVKLGTTFQQTENIQHYLSYAYDNERGYSGLSERKGNLISGTRARLSDSSSVYLEDRYQHGDAGTGLSRALGINLAPTERWSLSANWELGTLVDGQTNAETKRRAGGARVGYAIEDFQASIGVEYRHDENEQLDGTWTDRTTWLFRNSLRYQMTPSSRLIGKFNHSFSDSSQGQFYDGGFTEAVLGYAFRPVENDRLHTLIKYTYFYNVPTTDQVTLLDTPVDFIQKSHIAAVDVTYDLSRFFSIGGKYAYRLGQVSIDRQNPDFFDNNAHLYILRGDWRFAKNWEGTVEGRMLHLPDLDERKTGALFTVYRYLGDNLKVGVGYNFTDFSDDLTDLSYDHQGVFFNLVGTL